MKEKFGLDTFTLKIIAVITMIIDHVGAFLVPECLILRIIGRISFPIFAFLIVEGFYHTRDVRKYMIRLGTFALISEIPFDLVGTGNILEFSHQNIFFTLFIGVLLMYFYGGQYSKEAKVGCVILLLLAGDIFRVDYGAWGILMIFCFYIFRERTKEKFISVAFINIFAFGLVQTFAVIALLPIYLYNGEKGRSMKYLFYAIYPVHLLILFFLKNIV